MENHVENFQNGAKQEGPSAAEPVPMPSKTRKMQGNPGTNGPVRRVGSLTLGVCLITAGIFFLCNSFLPNFDAQMVLKIAPAGGLILLGCEVLFFAAKPERWKYDFLSVLICLILMGCCFCLAAIPVVLDEIDPVGREQKERLANQYQQSVYEMFREDAPEIRLLDMGCWADLYSGQKEAVQLTRDNTEMLGLFVQLYGPYESAEAFAKDCRQLTDVVQKQELLPNTIKFVCENTGKLPDELNTGSLQQTADYMLELNGLVQLDWTEAEMARETEVTDRLDEENPAETELEEPADSESAADAESESFD